MNNSLGRFCASRGRLVHRSKNLALTAVPQKYNPVQLFDHNGEFAPRWLVVDPMIVNGRRNGVTFKAGIKAMKRRGAYGKAVRAAKRLAWASVANG